MIRKGQPTDNAPQPRRLIEELKLLRMVIHLDVAEWSRRNMPTAKRVLQSQDERGNAGR